MTPLRMPQLHFCMCGLPMRDHRGSGLYRCDNCDAIQPQEYCGCTDFDICAHDRERVRTVHDGNYETAIERRKKSWYAKRQA